MSKVIPEGWCSLTLEEFSLVNMGQSPKGQYVNATGDGIPFYQGKTEFGKLYPTPRKNCTIPTKLAENGDILLSVRAPVGPTNLCQETSCIGRGLAGIRAYIEESQPFLHHFFRNIEPWLSQQGTGTTFKAVSGGFLKEISVCAPPLAEQKVIADKLDDLLAQVESTKARLDAIPAILKSFRQSVLAAAVSGKLTEEWRGETYAIEEGRKSIENTYSIEDKYAFDIPTSWMLTAIGNIANFQQGLQIAKSSRGKETDDGVLPILRTVNYENSFTKDVHYAFIDSKSIIAEPEDIVLSRTGTVGRVLTGYRGIMHNNSFRINYDTNVIIREFLIFFLSSPICQTYVRENSGRSTQPDLTHKAFARCPIPVLAKTEQTEIVRRVEELFAFADKVEAQVNAAQLRVNNLTQSILAKAFRGELTADWRAANPELISGDNSAEALLKRIKAEREALTKTTKKPAKKASTKKVKA